MTRSAATPFPGPVTLPAISAILLADLLTELDAFLRGGGPVVNDLADFLARRGHRHPGYDACVLIDQLSLTAARLRKLTAGEDDGRVQIRIQASDLPGRTCGPGDDFPGYSNIHVGVQRRDRRDDLLDLHPGDAPAAVWTLECSTAVTAHGVDLKGPYIQGRPGERFIYLSWGTVDDTGTFTLFRRAKLMFDAIGADVIDAAARSGQLLARLRLTDANGHPLCAAVRPPLIEWTVGCE
jgi:hypothetical protein